jgi:hypothetical protein
MRRPQVVQLIATAHGDRPDVVDLWVEVVDD